jgi:hypothetical protein
LPFASNAAITGAVSDAYVTNLRDPSAPTNIAACGPLGSRESTVYCAIAIARGVPLTAGFDPMNLLTDSSKTASWQAEGLPADPLSTQNASIICKCARFPLIIDPQMQAVA